MCYQRKNKFPVINEKDRMAIVSAIRYVDLVIPQENMDKLEIIKKYHCDAVFVGSDWKGTTEWNRYEKEFSTVGCRVVYLDYTSGISSTILRDKINDGIRL